MAKIHKEVNCNAEIGDRFKFPGVNLKVIRKADWGNEIQYTLESASGLEESWIVPNTNLEYSHERDRGDFGGICA